MEGAMKILRPAIYARRSKEQDDAEDETKSVNRQVENARTFAIAKGWAAIEHHSARRR
jgi:DNA invertase Pin-like site-specific DNA recombinase